MQGCAALTSAIFTNINFPGSNSICERKKKNDVVRPTSKACLANIFTKGAMSIKTAVLQSNADEQFFDWRNFFQLKRNVGTRKMIKTFSLYFCEAILLYSYSTESMNYEKFSSIFITPFLPSKSVKGIRN